MADHIRVTNPRQAIEARVGIQPIEELLDERDGYIQRAKLLHGAYGTFGTYGDTRKSELSRVRAMLRAQYHDAKATGVTEARLDEEAHCHPDYTKVITAATLGRAELYELENRITDVNDLIRRDNNLTYHSSAEARLG